MVFANDFRHGRMGGKVKGKNERPLASASQMKGVLSPYLKRRRLALISRWIPPMSCILDIGCDNASLLDLLPSFDHYTGLDIRENVIEANRLFRRGQNIHFIHGDILETKDLGSPFDVVVMAATIEHLREPDRVLSKLSAAALPNARLLVTSPVPLADTIMKWGSRIRLFARDSLKEHQRYFTREDFVFLADWRVIHYQKFELGLNQLIVMQKKSAP